MEKMFGDMMNQAKKIQEQMQEAQKKLADAQYQGESGAGLVTVVMSGRHDVKRINLDDSLMKEDKSLIEDLVAAAINDAVRKIEVENKDKILGMDLPQGFKMPF